MKVLINVLLIAFCITEIMVFDFSKKENINNWSITNDNVMGGLSSSKMVINDQGEGVFSGSISTDNNGGFAMTRLPVDITLLENTAKLVIKLKGDGKKYQFRIKSEKEQRFWYIQSFQTSTETEKIALPLNAFYASFRGNKLDIENFSAKEIKEIAILIGNKKNEEFKLKINNITLQ
ncbi:MULTISPECIES: CIA30 family protein [unclassified Tenacibaculum]|uniref:CIA30 family protein n=1 Tax=unclassified Tenacibaculum TaxID=2635139 RepID=UPI0021023523|nr:MULTISPECIES: CIA30 family protein [unclassified Tenacibaculum]